MYQRLSEAGRESAAISIVSRCVKETLSMVSRGNAALSKHDIL